ncbi:MAG: hypothetical protein AB7T63_10435 [Planctomycetota bacterium]
MTSGEIAVDLRSFQVAITGHRELEAERRPQLTSQVRAVLGSVATAACSAVAPAEPFLSLVTSLAEGADQLVAALALELGYTVHVVLPFTQQDVRQDLAERGDDVEAFDDLLAQATSVVALGGSLDDRPEAYARAGHVLQAHADLLVAVWDGEPARGRGGTADIVAAARQRAVPVLVVPSRSDRGPALEGGPSLEVVVHRALAPYARGAADHDAKRAEGQQACLSALARETARQGTWRWHLAAPFGQLWPWLAGSRRRTASPPEPGPPLGLPASLGAACDEAGRLARHYANLFRSAFLANFVLGTLAVGLALAGVLVLVGQLVEGSGAHGSTLGSAFAVAELASLLVMIAIWRLGRRGRWHEKAVDYRTLAEQLRALRLGWPLGLAPPRPDARAHTTPESDLSVHWTQHVVREVARRAGLPDVQMTDRYHRDVARALAGTVAEQGRYHRDVATQYARLHHRLEHGALLFALGALVPCVLHFLWHEPHITGWLLVLAAGLPAVAAALHGIDGQAELERLSKRSAAMAQWLDAIEAPSDDATWTELVAYTRSVVERMLDETNDWQVLSRAGGLKAT